MGRTGTYKKTKAITGTEQKLKKQGAREFQAAKGQRARGLELGSQFAEGTDPLSQQMREQFGVGGKAYQGTQGYEQAKQVFDPVAEYARANFQQQTLPDIQNTFGRGSKTSSALNQALAAAGTNLHMGLNAQFAPLVAQEQARQQQMQYGQMQNQQANQFNASGNLTQAGNQGAQIGFAKDKYAFTPKGTPVGTSLLLAGTESLASAAGKKMGQQYSAPAANTETNISGAA